LIGKESSEVIRLRELEQTAGSWWNHLDQLETSQGRPPATRKTVSAENIIAISAETGPDRSVSALLETLAANQMKKSDIDWLVPHQANLRIISATARKLNMSMDQVVVTVNEHGNTSAASIPLALDAAVRDGRIKRNEVVLLEAFGGGFTWGSALLRY